MTLNCAIEAQGSLVGLAAQRPGSPSQPPPKRGKVTTFSPASRRRLMRRLARMNAKKAVFMTLTYPAEFPGPRVAYTHLRAFLERFRRAAPKASAVWRLEYQKRGAPHYHIIWYGLPYIKWETVRKWWAEIIDAYVDDWLPRVELKMIWSARQLMYYVSKYVAKLPSPASGEDGYFIDVPYPHVGRFWGIHNKGELPYAARVFIRLSGLSEREFLAMKRVLANEWAGLNAEDGKGGIVFTDRAYIVLSELQEAWKGVANVI